MDCAAAGGWEKLVTLLIASGAEIDPTDKSKVQFHCSTRQKLLSIDVAAFCASYKFRY